MNEIVKEVKSLLSENDILNSKISQNKEKIVNLIEKLEMIKLGMTHHEYIEKIVKKGEVETIDGIELNYFFYKSHNIIATKNVIVDGKIEKSYHVKTSLYEDDDEYQFTIINLDHEENYEFEIPIKERNNNTYLSKLPKDSIETFIKMIKLCNEKKVLLKSYVDYYENL